MVEICSWNFAGDDVVVLAVYDDHTGWQYGGNEDVIALATELLGGDVSEENLLSRIYYSRVFTRRAPLSKAVELALGKHLQGQHDQREHGRKRGAPATSAVQPARSVPLDDTDWMKGPSKPSSQKIGGELDPNNKHVNSVQVREFPNGRRAIFKTLTRNKYPRLPEDLSLDEAQNERDAYLASGYVGAVVPPTRITEEMGNQVVIQEFSSGVMGERTWRIGDSQMAMIKSHPKSFAGGAILDYVMAQSDRHGFNLLVNEESGLVLIDNGVSSHPTESRNLHADAMRYRPAGNTMVMDIFDKELGVAFDTGRDKSPLFQEYVKSVDRLDEFINNKDFSPAWRIRAAKLKLWVEAHKKSGNMEELALMPFPFVAWNSTDAHRNRIDKINKAAEKMVPFGEGIQ